VMGRRLKENYQIHKLAGDLGIKAGSNVVTDILAYCERRVKELMVGCTGCTTLSEGLDWVAAKMKTEFRVVRNDKDLASIVEVYAGKGETAFAGLEKELSSEGTLGITIKRLNREPWETAYVSVIDCRGKKAAREYFTKWHEVAHLLTQTEQMRLVFRRTHRPETRKDPEEVLMDLIAGRLGYNPPFQFRRTMEQISFEAIEDLRTQLCPEASKESALIGFVTFWPAPCFLVRARMGFKRGEQEGLKQPGFYFADSPTAALRAVRVTPSNSARESGLMIHENRRIPEASVIYRVLHEEIAYDEAEENLVWWESSSGRSLADCRVLVKARLSWEGVDALIIPLGLIVDSRTGGLIRAGDSIKG
jgi:hypothetical protein